MKKEELFYYRGKKKVPFEPRSNLLAASVRPDLSDEQNKELLEYCSQLKLKPEKVGAPITEANVRIFRFPADTSEKDKVEIQKRLNEHPLVRRVGPVIHLRDRSVSFMTNEFVVKFREQISENKLGEIARGSNLKVIRRLPYGQNTYILCVDALAHYDLLEIINKLARKDIVEYAEPNLVSTPIVHFTPNDFLFASQPHHQLIQTEAAWDITRGDKDIIIAVIDNGCDFDHPDFTNDASLGWDKVYKRFDFTGMDDNPTNPAGPPNGGHGTKSCGIAAANADNSEGVAGVAPGCRLMPIRWLSSGTASDWADLYLWVAGFDPESTDPDFPDPIYPGADVISNSIGVLDNPISGVMRDAFDYITDHGRDGKGCVVVFAAGNDNQDVATDTYGQWAAYGRTITVASSAISPPDASEVKISTSNFGGAIDVCAPAGGPSGGTEARTLSTDNAGEGDTAGSASATTNDYSDFGQTSCACPQVAGIAALILSVNPDLTWDQVRQIIRDTAEPIDVGNTNPVGQWVDTDGDGIADFSQWYGFGRVNAASAVCRARWGVEKHTESLVFNDVPEGETTTRAVVFTVESPCAVHFQIIDGPTVVSGPADTDFGTPFGTTATLGITTDFTSPREVRLWISYAGTTDGDEATGTVTIRCQETDEEWIIPITANTVSRPAAVVLLALDQSNSMSFNSGLGPGITRGDVLKFSAPPMVDVIEEGNAIGIISFDHDSHDVMPVTPVVPLGRLTANGHIAAYSHNPHGWTSLGEAVARAHDLLHPVTGYDIKAMIVLTDGRENHDGYSRRYISDVADMIDEHVYAIGLGTAENIQPSALQALCDGHEGYFLITGALDVDAYFRLAKYYQQILAGVENRDIIVDPEGWLRPGQTHRIPFHLNETDISTDVILLTPAPYVFKFSLETPGGDVIDPGVVAANPVLSYRVGSNVSYYRLTLPVPIGGGEAREGMWHVVLTINADYYKRYLANLEKHPEEYQRVHTHGLRYCLTVHTRSSLHLRVSLSQNSHEPGATLTLRAILTEYGVPVESRAAVKAELERPDTTKTILTLVEGEPGVFATSTPASNSGIYRFRVIGTGKTFRGRRFTREHIVTGAVWQGGDQPSPSGKDDPRKGDIRLCRLLACLVNEKIMGRYLAEKGVDTAALKECLKAYCEDAQSSSRDDPALSRLEITRMLDDPRVHTALLTLLQEK